MNDRYLCRAKRTDNGEWVEGGSMINFCDDGIRSYYMPALREKCICTHDENDNIIGFENCIFYKVNPSTLCQCTGLKDKNGKLIWENDIVKIGGVIYMCFWNENNFEWGFKNNAEDFGIAYVSANGIKVIGSAIDNPELLEVGE